MDKEIKKILEDIYAIDDSLKKHEKELIVTIKKLISARPSVSFDESFRNNLRLELLEKFSEKKNKKFNFNFMNKLYYAFGALILVLIIMVPTLLKQGPGPNNPVNINFALDVNRLSEGAFGPLVAHDTDVSEREAVAGLGGGGGGLATDSKIATMPYQPINYVYVYEGEDFSVDGDKMAVLKKIKGLSSQAEASRILQNLNFDNIDLSSLNNLKLRNFTAYEDKDFGYSVNVDLYEGMISINEYWEKWPMYLERDVATEAISIEDVPSDEKLIAMADKFLKDRNISTADYAAPVVNNSWRQMYLKTEDKNNYPVPEIANIVYPSIVDGKEVYEEWGNVRGLMVAINLRYGRVVNVWNLSTNKYQSSLYDMETDTEKILELASRGGAYYPVLEGNAKLVEIKIGTPYIAYVQTWHFANNINSELLVPALVFPVTDIPEDSQFYRENVVIPLAKDIVSQRMELY